MGSLDLAGVIGTWVAAGLALIALLGVVAPILIWRASRTERHQAIVRIGLRNYGYVSRGIPVWPGVRLWQTVRAPRINMAKKFKDEEWNHFDMNRMRITNGEIADSPASWVSFGAFLGGYSVAFETDGDVAIKEGIAMLPVNKAFLMTFALVGRFSDEPNRRRKVRGDGIRTWDRRGSKRYNAAEIELVQQSLSRAGADIPDEQLHGLTGSLYFVASGQEVLSGNFGRDSWSVVFVGQPTTEMFEIRRDAISLEAMGMLCLGFLPFKKDSFVNILDPLREDDTKGEDSDDPDDDIQVGKGYSRRQSRPDYVVDSRSPRPVRFKTPTGVNEAMIKVIAYELLPITVTKAEILEAFTTREDVKFLALYEMKLDGKTRSDLRELSEQTFVPATASWVRFQATPSRYGESSIEYFIRRQDAQQAAFSLLDLKWHPEGYLIPGVSRNRKRAKVMEMLCSISERARPFLIRLRDGVSSLDLTSADQQSFLDRAEQVIKKATSAATRSSLSQALFSFDEFVSTLQHERVEVQQMVGVLMLTNEEFTGLVYQSARHMSASSDVRIEIDLRTGILSIPSTFGTLQTFEIDMDILYKDQLPLGAPARISVKHSDILKGALRAYLRSLMLESCYDAEPLTDCFERITNDVLYMT